MSSNPGALNGAALYEALKANGYDPPGPGATLVDPERYPLLFALRPRTISMLRRSLHQPHEDRPTNPGTEQPFTDDEIILKVGHVYPTIVLAMTALADDRAEPHPDVTPKTRAFLTEKVSAILERNDRAERDPAASALRNENSAITRELGAAGFELRELLAWLNRTAKEAPAPEYRSAAFFVADFKKELGLPVNAGVRVCWHADLARRGEELDRAEKASKTEFKKWQKAVANILSGKTG